MQVGRVAFGNALVLTGTGKPGAAETVLGGTVKKNLVPWIVGGFVLVVIIIAVFLSDKEK